LESIEKIESVLSNWTVESPPPSTEKSVKLSNHETRAEPTERLVTTPDPDDDEALRSVYAEFYAQALLHVTETDQHQQHNVTFDASYTNGAHDAAPTLEAASASYLDADGRFVNVSDITSADLDNSDRPPPPPPRPLDYYFAQAARAPPPASPPPRSANDSLFFTDDDEVNSVLAEFYNKAAAVAAAAASPPAWGAPTGSPPRHAGGVGDDELDEAEVDALLEDLQRAAAEPEWARMDLPPPGAGPRLSQLGDVDPVTGDLIVDEPDDARDLHLILRLLCPTFAAPPPPPPTRRGPAAPVFSLTAAASPVA
jgi:hypothetical protein